MNLSGIGINKVFKTNIPPNQPYYYVSGSLDLSGAVVGGTYFFNLDNNFKYATERDYYNFIMVDDNSVISEVEVYSNLGIDSVDPQSTWFAIGGADYMAVDNSVKVWWAAPPAFGPYTLNNLISTVSRNGSNVATINTVNDHGIINGQKVNIICPSNVSFNAVNATVTVTGNKSFTYSNTGSSVSTTFTEGLVIKTEGQIYNGYPLNENEVNSGCVNYFGHSGGQYPYNLVSTDDPFTLDTSKRYKYLAVTILDQLPDNPVIDSQESPIVEEQKTDSVVIVEEQQSKNLNQRQKKVFYRGLPSGDKAINSGTLSVTLKIYPKAI